MSDLKENLRKCLGDEELSRVCNGVKLLEEFFYQINRDS